jgi:hypothetical protein
MPLGTPLTNHSGMTELSAAVFDYKYGATSHSAMNCNTETYDRTSREYGSKKN